MNIDDLLGGLREFLTQKQDSGPHFSLLRDGKETKYDAGSPKENAKKLQEVLGELKDFDVVELGDLEFAIDQSFPLENLYGVKIRGGRFIRQGSDLVKAVFRIKSCAHLTISGAFFDAKCGISAPQTNPPQHTLTNPNDNTYTSFIHAESTAYLKVENCQFRDLAARRIKDKNFVKYEGAYGVRVGIGCIEAVVQNCEFEKLGYAGLQDQGVATTVDRCNFVDCQWHGYVYNGKDVGHSKISNCSFSRHYFNSMGYFGAININPPEPYKAEHISITNCRFTFPYDVEKPMGGSFMIKAQDVEDLLISGCSFVHGQTGGSGNSNSIRFQHHIGRAKIENCWLAGSIWHITWDDQPYDLILENSTINGRQLDRWGAYVMPRSLTVRDSVIFYDDCAFTDWKYEPVAGTFAFTSENSVYVPKDGRDSSVIGKKLHKDSKVFRFDDTNLVKSSKKFKHSIKE